MVFVRAGLLDVGLWVSIRLSVDAEVLMSTYYPPISAGERVFPARSGYRMACCDCGLVHLLKFELVKVGNGRKIALRAWRDDYETKQNRKRRNRK